jgi:AcrR family transcriptional regulator
MAEKKKEEAFDRLKANLPKQKRSRETLGRLLDAAEAILSETASFEAATVPAIAARAGMSVGVVYRRFPHKDALLQAVYERYFSRMRERNLAALQPQLWNNVPFHDMVHALITGMVQGYYMHRGLLRALHLYSQTHGDEIFRKRAEELNRATLPLVASLLLMRREEIGHPEPEAAIHFGLLVLAFALNGYILSDAVASGFEVQPPSGPLDDELVRLFLGYLGVDASEETPSMRRRREVMAMHRAEIADADNWRRWFEK